MGKWNNTENVAELHKQINTLQSSLEASREREKELEIEVNHWWQEAKEICENEGLDFTIAKPYPPTTQPEGK